MINYSYQIDKNVPFDRGKALAENLHLRMVGEQFSGSQSANQDAKVPMLAVFSDRFRYPRGEKSMTTGSYDPRNTEQLDSIIIKAIEEALYYPSLKDAGCDDELLPSGD